MRWSGCRRRWRSKREALSMAKHLERVLQEKVSPGALKGTSVALEGVETGEKEGDHM